MRYLAALITLAALGNAHASDIPPLRLVVSAEAVEELCNLRVACYQGGEAYVRPHDPYLPPGRYVLEIPEGWQPPPWPRPVDNLGLAREIESGRALLEHNGIPAGQIFNRAAHIAHEAGHHVGLEH